MENKFYTDQFIEQPFFLEMVSQFNGRKTRPVNGQPAYRVQCPCCKRNKAVFGHSRNRDTFILLCPVDICTNKGGKVLHDIINHYGDKKIKKKWWEARRKKEYTDNEWKGIKNRVAYKDRKSRDKSFKEKMDLKTETSRIKILNRSHNRFFE